MKHTVLILGAGGCWGRNIMGYFRTRSDRYNAVPIDSLDVANVREEIDRLIEYCQPAYIINLIGTFSGTTQECYEINTFFPIQLMNAIRDTQIQLILVGSAAEYGMVKTEDLPLTEDNLLNPISDYGISKAAQYFHMRQYVQQYDIDVRLLRVFNLIGEGLSERLALGAFAKRIAHLAQEGSTELVVGNLKPKRDYIGVSTATQMLEAVMERGSAGGVYHICSGYSITMEELVQKMIDRSGLDGITLTVDPAFLKRFDVPNIYGSREKVSALLSNLTDNKIYDAYGHDLGSLLEGEGITLVR